jgi:ATP synthase protein I
MNPEKDEMPSGWNDLSGAYRRAAPYLNISYILISSIILFGIGGWWIDGKMQTRPLFFILGLFAGLGVGFYSFFKTLKKLDSGK